VTLRPALALLVALVPLAARAEPQSCTFSTECYSQLECKDSSWAVTADLEAGTVTDLTGTFDIVGRQDGADWTSVAFAGYGGMQVLTLGRNAWIMSVHIGAGPAVMTYYGDCGD